MRLIATTLLLAGLAVPAGAPPGFHLWTAAELKAFSKSLAPKINAQKVATQPLAAFGNYGFMMAHREGSGEAEYHETQADIMVINSGAATLVYGGSVVNGKTTAPNEIRGPSISGGTEVKVSPGDVITIPIKTAHQMKLAAGQEITYFVVKVTQ